MQTLVIHPKDETTDFLSVICADKDWTVVNTRPSNSKLKELIKSHDRIIMLGHGTKDGLVIMEGAYNYHFLIDSSLVYLLRQKDCVCIWCNADVFVRKYGLKGFFTGIIISEYQEAIMYCVNTNSEDLLHSNLLFADSIKQSIMSADTLSDAKKIYEGDTSVINFNKQNLYFS